MIKHQTPVRQELHFCPYLTLSLKPVCFSSRRPELPDGRIKERRSLIVTGDAILRVGTSVRNSCVFTAAWLLLGGRVFVIVGCSLARRGSPSWRHA